MKNESYYEEESSKYNNKRIDRVLKFTDSPNANYPNKHKKFQNKNNTKNSNDSDSCDLWIFWYIFVSFILLICLLYFFFFIGFPVKNANVLASEYGKKIFKINKILQKLLKKELN